jgi:hypothetical protein
MDNRRINNLVQYVRGFFTRDEEAQDNPVESEEVGGEENEPTERSSGILNIIENLSQAQLRRILRRDATNNDSDEGENRRYYYFDEEAESHDELVNPREDDEYIDFRTYPLPIDWDDIEGEKSDAYRFYDKYGYFGANIYMQLNNTISFKASKFETQLIEKYVSLSKSPQEAVDRFIKNLPTLAKVREVLYKNMFNRKELVTMKIYFDILEHYYINHDSPCFKVHIVFNILDFIGGLYTDCYVVLFNPRGWRDCLYF